MTPTPTAAALAEGLATRSTNDPAYATEAVDAILRAALAEGASDLHLAPVADGLDVRWRLDGVLQPVAVLPKAVASKVIARLKVMAELLTYRTEIPQEGRIRGAGGDVEMRLSTFPTLYGEKAVVRVFPGAGAYRRLDDLGFPDEILGTLRRALGATSGAVVFSGPAGSGKTTTLYACLRELAATTNGERCLTSMEDPIEVAVPGVAQSQVNVNAGFTLEVGLRSLLRQDPEVIAVGEIRDAATAGVAFQAALTGHLVLSTFHSGSAAGVVGRLSDMGIEPYLLRSGLLAVVAQRLVRRLCECAVASDDPAACLGLPVSRFKLPAGCERCGMTGYRGRLVLAEMLSPDRTDVGRAILSRTDTSRLEELAVAAGMVSRWERARQAVEAGLTSPAEIRRVLGDERTPDEFREGP
jgi:type II secretory ATPase GspE/PulE/Tfp pilus assembly ATPase PilB-like protein